MTFGKPSAGAQRAAPALIALPGTLMDASSLHRLATALGQPGMQVELLGDSDDFDAEIERLAALAAPAGPAIWIGHSLGGIAALHLAARYPERCLAVVAIASNLRPDGAQGPQRRAEQRACLRHSGMHGLVQQTLSPLYGVPHDAERINDLAAQAERVGTARFQRQLGYAAQRPGLARLGHRWQVPVLALSGQYDLLSPPACSDEIVAHAGKVLAQHHSLAGANHLLPQQSSRWCAARITGFLAPLGVRL